MGAPAPPRVLLADDDRRSARVLARMLREDGFDVEVVFDGAAAVGRLSREPLFDILLTDVRMPYVDGVAVARYARSRRSDMRVWFVTSYPELIDPQGLPLEGTRIHAKPVDYARLHDLLCAEGLPPVPSEAANP